MNLLAVERMKLLSIRSPWWCAVTAVALAVLFTGLSAMNSGSSGGMHLTGLSSGLQTSMVVVLALAAISVTSEYRFGTIRTTFQAVPDRTSVLFAKAGVVAALGFVLGELAALLSWVVALGVAPGPGLAVDDADAWRELLGAGPVFACAAVLAVGVGALLRQTAGAVTFLLIWTLLAENLISAIPNFGSAVGDWLPFHAGMSFFRPMESGGPLGPWGALAYFAAVAVAVLTVAAFVVRRRDA